MSSRCGTGRRTPEGRRRRDATGGSAAVPARLPSPRCSPRRRHEQRRIATEPGGTGAPRPTALGIAVYDFGGHGTGPAAGPRHRLLRRVLRAPGPGSRPTGTTAGASTSGPTAGPTGRPTATSPGPGSPPTCSPSSTTSGCGDPFGFGHSCGGAAVLLAEQARPGPVPLPLLLRTGGHARRGAGGGCRQQSPGRRGPSPAGRRSPPPRRPSPTSPPSRPSPNSILRPSGSTSRPASNWSRPTREATAGPSGCDAAGRTRPTRSPPPASTRPSPTCPRSAARSPSAAGSGPTPSGTNLMLADAAPAARRPGRGPAGHRTLRTPPGRPMSWPTSVIRAFGVTRAPAPAHPGRSLYPCPSNYPVPCPRPR